MNQSQIDNLETICLKCEHRFGKIQDDNCPKCGSDDLGMIPKDKQLLRF